MLVVFLFCVVYEGPFSASQKTGHYLSVILYCMPEEINQYLKDNNIGVLAVEMPDGSHHGATVHFAHSTTPFFFISKQIANM